MNLSINQSIDRFTSRHSTDACATVRLCRNAESRRNVLRQILNVLTDGAVWQFSSLGMWTDGHVHYLSAVRKF